MKIITKDGSATLFNEEYQESYRSVTGALEETFEKFIKPSRIVEKTRTGSVKILDIGFGLGYNAIAAVDTVLNCDPNAEVFIISLEKDLILKELKELKPKLRHYFIIDRLEYDPVTKSYFYEDKNIYLKIKIGKAEEEIKKLKEKFDVVFLDPFSPKKNPELWSEEFFFDIAKLLNNNAVLTTYSCARNVRDNLKKTGFDVFDGPKVGRRGPSTVAIFKKPKDSWLIMLTYNELIKQHLKILKNLQYSTGLFSASDKKVVTGYNKSWLRDNFYECMAFEVIGDWDTVEKTYDALLKVFLKHEYKIDYAIEKKPMFQHEYIHARFNPETFDEYWEEWGNKQNDSIGAILFRIGELEHHHKRSILNTEDKVRIVNKLVKYLESIEYWHDLDSGMWEEDEEVHASSVGACVAGLKSIKRLEKINVPDYIIYEGEKTLNHILPRESKKKFVDLALLSLIYPYHIVTKEQAAEILKNVEYLLLRKRGVVRYKNDHYYNKNPDGYSEEAEWTFGLSWLAIIHEKLGQEKKAQKFVDMMLKTLTDFGVPELYFSNSKNHNENNPLGWAESLFIVALHDVNAKFIKEK